MFKYLIVTLGFIQSSYGNITVQTTVDSNVNQLRSDIVDDSFKKKTYNSYNSYNSYVPNNNHIIEKKDIYVEIAIILFSFLALIISFFTGYYIYLDFKYKKYKNINREISNPELIPGGLPLYDEL